MFCSDYIPPVLYDLYPRTDIEKFGPGHNQDNDLRGWACKVTIKGKQGGILDGKRVCLKDNICLAGVPCQFGTSVVEDFVRMFQIIFSCFRLTYVVDCAAEIDATVTTRILEHGGIIAGKATCEVSDHLRR
jgi:amidase